MKRIAIVSKEQLPVTDAMLSKLQDLNPVLLQNLPDNSDEFDTIIGIGIEKGFNGLACHYSLLPAFEEYEPVKHAFLAGCKVTGITIYQTEPFKIIAQYPYMISNCEHFDETEKQLKYLEQIIYPLVAEKYIKNEPFEMKDLLGSKNCTGNCGSCGGCT